MSSGMVVSTVIEAQPLKVIKAAKDGLLEGWNINKCSNNLAEIVVVENMQLLELPSLPEVPSIVSTSNYVF